MVFVPFGSFSDMMAWQVLAEQKANEAVSEEQKAIGPGDYWFSIESQKSAGIAEFGRIHTREEYVSGEVDGDSLDNEGERSDVLVRLDDSLKRGYRFGHAYSVLSPEGSLGTAHVLHMRQITKEQFEEARDAKWIADDLEWC